MKQHDRDVKPWSLWPITGILNVAFHKALLYIQPLIIFRMISTTLLRIHNFPAIIHRRVGRRERVLVWLNNIIKDRNIPDIQTVWRDGSILCSVIDSTIPRLEFPDRSSLRLAQNFAFLYLGVPPAFTEEELCQETFYPHLERRLVRYLCSLQSAIARHPPLPLPVSHDPTPHSSSCLARGMGLITAAQYDRAHFYLYLLDSNLALGEISVELQSNEDFGFARIDHKCSTSAPRKFANIPIRFVLNSNSLRINYTPQSSGMHQLSVLRKGFHIQGSPFSVPVEKNDPKQSCKTHIQDRKRTPRKKLRVLLRIVDFVTEKMLLTEDGKLESISVQDFLQFQQQPPNLFKMGFVDKQGEGDQSAARLKRRQHTAAHDSHGSSGEYTLHTVNTKCLQRQVSVRSPCASPVGERETSDKSINKGSEFKTRCKKIVAACHFIMNHGSKQKRLALLNAAGQILDGRPVTLGEDVEQLLRIVPSISIEDTDEESIPVVISPTEDTELTARVGENSVDNAGDILDKDLFELHEPHGEIIEDPPWDETMTLQDNNRPLMFIDNMFNDTDEPDLEWFSGERVTPSRDSLNTHKGPASSSSPCYNAIETATFTDIDAYLSKDFTAYMMSETQFHLWPSDVAFGDQCHPSTTSDEEALVDFDAVLAAPNLEEALNKLEQGLKKKKAKRDEKMVESDTGEKLRSSAFGNGALNSQQSEEMPLINLEEDSFDPHYNEREDDNSAVLAMNEVQFKEQELTSPAEENRYISSDITEGDESTDYFGHGYLKTFACKYDLEIKPHTFDDEQFTLFSGFCENNLQQECVNQSATNYDTSFEETPPCSIPPEDTVDTNEECENVEENGPLLAYDEPPENDHEYYDSDEEELGPPPEGDSAYLSIDDIQNSFGYSPENRSNEDPGQYNHKLHKVTSPLDFEDAEILNWNQNGNLAITGFMGPAEKDVLGIGDNEETEDSLHNNWQLVLRYTRVLTPLAVHMSAIAEEEERDHEGGGCTDVEAEDSLDTRESQENSNEAIYEKRNSRSPNIDNAINSLIPVLNLPGIDNEEKNQHLQKEDVPGNTELLIKNTNSNQENCSSLCIPADTLNADFQRDETLLNFVYVHVKKQLIEIEGDNIINSINEIIDVNAMENYVSETTIESSDPLVERDDDYIRLEKTADDVDGTNLVNIERTNADPLANEATLVKSNSKEDTATQALDSLGMNNNQVINDVNISGNLIDGFPVAMKVKLRKEYWDKKLLEGNQSIHLKKSSHSQITNTQSKMKSNFLALGAKNESEELQHNETKTAKTGGEIFSEDKSDSPEMADKLVEKDEDHVIENDFALSLTRKYWSNVLERSMSPPVAARSPSLHHARRVMVSEDCDDECPTPPSEPEHKSGVLRDLVNQRRSQQIISTVSNPRYNKINKEEIRSRFEKAKHFFQSLEHNSVEVDASLKSWDGNASLKRRLKRKKPTKATSAPSSDSETAARTARQAGSTIGGSERIKVAERFHVKDLFKDVTGGQDAGFMQGVPHRAAVLRALQSMEMERPVSPYENADYCCPHDYHSQENTRLISKRKFIEKETIYFV